MAKMISVWLKYSTYSDTRCHDQDPPSYCLLKPDLQPLTQVSISRPIASPRIPSFGHITKSAQTFIHTAELYAFDRQRQVASLSGLTQTQKMGSRGMMSVICCCKDNTIRL